MRTGVHGALLLAALISGRALANGPADPEPITIILDPGHTPKNGGATGVRGIKEVVYNDRLAALVADTLAAYGIQVVLTRRPGKEAALEDRVAVSRDARARCFISLHHDSAQPKYLERIDSGAAEAFATLKPIRGYSLFVSAKNGRYGESLALARRLGRSLSGLGRKPTLHHAEPIPGENRPLLDSALGIYRYDDLVVLARNPLPAVLIEFGVLVDRADEAYVSDPGNQARFARAVREAIEGFVRKE